MKKIIIMSLIGFFLLVVVSAGITFFEAYFEWQHNKERLMNNLRDYYKKIVEGGKNKYLVLDEEGKVIEVTPTRIYDINNRIIGEFAPTKRQIVKFNEIPKNLIRGLIAVEDKEFYKHHGINIRGILRAIYHDLKAFKLVEGGSSITQQLAKILITSRKKTFKRKFLELFAAFNIEKTFTKDEILLMYLNTVYLGHGIYGIESAAKTYFNKDVKNLNIFESALLISLIPAPNYYSPYFHPDISMKKHLIVLNKLKKAGLVSSYNFDERYKRFWKNLLADRNRINISYWKMDINNAPYVVEYVRQFLVKHFYVSEILQGGLKVYTTIDLNVQNKIRASADIYLSDFIKSKTNKKYYKDLQTAIVVMSPSNGNILGFIGGKNYSFNNQLNRAYKMRRQIGSSIKPFVYTYGIDTKRITLTTIFTDKIVKYDDHGRVYSPKNYSDKYIGKVFAGEALIKSINTVAVQLLNILTPDEFINNVLNKIYTGVTIEQINNTPAREEFIDGLSLALGTVEMSPVEVGIGFSVIANGGHKVEPILIKSVFDKDNNKLIDCEIKRQEKIDTFKTNREYNIFSTDSCFITSYMLKKVFQPGGTGYYAAKKVGLNITLSGKTGTTSGFKDAWCTGFTKDYVASVWVGFDDYNKTLGFGATGGRVAGPILVDLFNKIYYGKSVKYLTPEDNGVVFCDVCGETGKLADSSCTNIMYNVPFLKGTEPAEY